MLDPIIALSVAGVVVQFVEIGIKVVSKGSQISRSADGALAENVEVENITGDLLMLATRLETSSTSMTMNTSKATSAASSLEELIIGCKAVAFELLEALQQLKTKPGQAKWKSYRQALKSVMSKDKLDNLAQRLSVYREELQLHVLVSLRESIDIIELNQAQAFDKLDKNTQALALLLYEQRDRPRIEYENLNFTIISQPWDKDHNGSKEKEINIKHDDFADAQVSTDILDTLAFPSMWARQEQVAEAYAHTFGWIFEDPQADTRPWASFTRWLKDPSGKIYWINGKAGSGKSTLMKFLYNDARMHALLKTWSGELPLIVVGHFFWNSGGDVLQMSRKGLLRVLLHEALNKYHGLVPIVLPRHGLSADLKSWSLSKLREVFDILATQQAIQVKLCFFIDGLDEYDGNCAELVEIFRRHAESPNVKFCLSSRPLLVFDHCLSGYPRLRLQDLTHEDIRVVVSERLGKNKRMLALTLEELGRVSKLISDIVDKADGVFLWVDLVVTSLLSGLQDHNHLSDLQKRVDILPSKLEDLYEHMLNTIDPYYHPESSRIFQIFRAAGNRIEGVDLYLANQEDVELALNSSINSKSIGEIGQMHENMDALLKTRCAGLLECQDTGFLHSRRAQRRLKSPIVYIHQTARDFLEKSRIWTRIEAWSGQSPCDPWVLLLAGCVLRLKFVSRNTKGSDEDQSLLRDSLNLRPWIPIKNALEFASHGTKEMLSLGNSLLDEIEKTMAVHWATTKMEGHDGWILSRNLHPEDSWTGSIFPSPLSYNHQSSMLSLAVQAGLLQFVKDKTEHDIKLIKGKPGRPLLDYTLNCKEVCGLVSEEMVAYLLSHGASPNQRFEPDDKTPWENSLGLFIRDLIYLSSTRFETRPCEFGGLILKWVRIYILLVQHGADPNVFCEISRGKESRRGYGSVLEILNTKLQSRLEDWEDAYSLRARYQSSNQQKEFGHIRNELANAISILQNLLVAKGAKATFIKIDDWAQLRPTGSIIHNNKDNFLQARRGLSGLKKLFCFPHAD